MTRTAPVGLNVSVQNLLKPEEKSSYRINYLFYLVIPRFTYFGTLMGVVVRNLNLNYLVIVPQEIDFNEFHKSGHII